MYNRYQNRFNHPFLRNLPGYGAPMLYRDGAQAGALPLPGGRGAAGIFRLDWVRKPWWTVQKWWKPGGGWPWNVLKMLKYGGWIEDKWWNIAIDLIIEDAIEHITTWWLNYHTWVFCWWFWPSSMWMQDKSEKCGGNSPGKEGEITITLDESYEENHIIHSLTL